MGRTPARANRAYWDPERNTGNAWVSIADLSRSEGGVVDDTKEYLSDAGAELVPEVESGTLLLSFKLSLGKLAFAGRDLRTNEAIAALPIARPDLILKEYLYYFLESVDWASVAGVDAKVKGRTLNKKTLSALPITFPESLAEQERIVRILDEALDAIDTAQANTRANIDNTDALFLAYLKNLFANPGADWHFKTVDQLADRCLGKMLDRAKNRGEPKPYLRNFNVRWFDFDLSDVSSMKFLESEADRYRVQDGDVVVCEGGYPGRAAVWSGSSIYFQKALHRVRFTEPALSWWFVYYLYFADATGTLRDHFTGTGISHFTGKALGRFSLPVPELNELRDTLEGIHELRSQCTQLARQQANQLQVLDRLRRSALQDAIETGLQSAASRASERQSE